MRRTEVAAIVPSRRLSAACQVSFPAGQEPPLKTIEPVVRKGQPIHRQAGVLLKQILACVLVASPFALLLALRLGARRLDPQYTVLALGAVVVLVLLVIVPSLANRLDDSPRGRAPERDARRPNLPKSSRDVHEPSELP
jgi:hypothetical protein